MIAIATVIPVASRNNRPHVKGQGGKMVGDGTDSVKRKGGSANVVRPNRKKIYRKLRKNGVNRQRIRLVGWAEAKRALNGNSAKFL